MRIKNGNMLNRTIKKVFYAHCCETRMACDSNLFPVFLVIFFFVLMSNNGICVNLCDGYYGSSVTDVTSCDLCLTSFLSGDKQSYLVVSLIPEHQ